jgi:secondary thiamine-phosphate synthase enzyme
VIKEISLNTSSRNELVDITNKIEELVSDVKEGIVTVFCPHTTAAITINEGADPDVKKDILWKLSQLIPKDEDYKHSEGNSDAHIKSSLIGCSESVIVKDGKLVLGTWQSIYFCEFDGPRNRKVIVNISKS